MRALRRRRGWRQLDLARAAGCSQTEVSLIERGHPRSVTIVRAVVAALDAQLVLDVRWRGGALDRLLDEDHAALVGSVARFLIDSGWEVQVEVTYASYGERGSFDVLAFMPSAGVLLVIEIKTDLVSAEATFRKLDEKARLAPSVARERFGWQARHVARVLVLADTSTVRRRVKRHDVLFARALPVRGAALRRWLAEPSGALGGLWFLSASTSGARIQRRGGRERVRCPKVPPRSTPDAA